MLGRSNREPSRVVRLPIPEGDDALVSALRARRPGATDALFERYIDHIRRVVVRVMNIDGETEDIIHDIFLGAITSIDGLKDPHALKGWLTSIALFRARRVLRQRKRWRWLSFAAPEELNKFAAVEGSELNEAMRCTYLVLSELPPDERIAFALRFIDGMELTEVADACRTSVATIKRRLSRAEERFIRKARKYPALSVRIETGGRWNL